MSGFKEFVPIDIKVNSNGTGCRTRPRSQDRNKHSISDNLLTIKPANEWIDIAKNQPMPNMLFGPLWHEGELCILTADTNVGKSILGVQIADCITRGMGNYYLPFRAEPQSVIYGDFELSYKQFENRYSTDYSNHYLFSENLFRLEINPDFSELVDFNEQLLLNLELLVEQTGSRVIIIDNLTFLRTQSMDTAKEAFILSTFTNGKNAVGKICQMFTAGNVISGEWVKQRSFGGVGQNQHRQSIFGFKGL